MTFLLSTVQSIRNSNNNIRSSNNKYSVCTKHVEVVAIIIMMMMVVGGAVWCGNLVLRRCVMGCSAMWYGVMYSDAMWCGTVWYNYAMQ